MQNKNNSFTYHPLFRHRLKLDVVRKIVQEQTDALCVLFSLSQAFEFQFVFSHDVLEDLQRRQELFYLYNEELGEDRELRCHHYCPHFATNE